ncbi:MAG TPA: hypothetical protein VGB89_08045 [Bacteroidota bacterium]
MRWSGGGFDHNKTAFPLTGAHVAVQCQTCHTNGNFQLVYTDCYQCHASDFAGTRNPNHVTGNFSHDCIQCHNTVNWGSTSFNHAATNFPLTGAHIAVQCQDCHTNGNYQLVYNDCYQCHATDFTGTTNPNHVTGNFSHDCIQCHNTVNWGSTSFDHATTNFPLTGAHIAVQCQTCHTNGNYQLVYNDCYQCHATDFNGTTNPNHVTGTFSHNCVQCHSTVNWNSTSFDHATTNFPLTGAHIEVQCQTCHTNGNYQLVYNDCYQCHATDFTGTTNPNHVTGNFSHNCVECHSTVNWNSTSFDHATTNFPLTGAHIAVQCQTCHTNGNYQLVYNDCYQCHATDFNGSTNPNHVAGNFSHNCTQCHTTMNWSPATFDHATTNFPLTGAHTTASCQSCHVNGNYQLVYNDCYQCHATDFNSATNPNHVVPGFSHDCVLCHSTAAWAPSTFAHDAQYFRIYSGKHRGKWTLCSQCHLSPSNFGDFTCITCHEHRQSNVDPEHNGVPGYVYTATSCYNCHRNV